MDEQPGQEYDSFSNHLKPPAGEFGPEDDPQYFQDQLHPTGSDYYGGVRHADDYGGEEKKIGIEEHVGTPLVHQMSKDSSVKSGEDDFIPIKRDGYQLGPQSIVGSESVASYKSSAFLNAQELLRKNRRKRQTIE